MLLNPPRCLFLLAALCVAGAGAQIGQPLTPFLNSPELAAARAEQAGVGKLNFADGSSAVLQSRGGYLTGAQLSVVQSQGAAARAAELAGLLSGYGAGLAEPMLGFLQRPDVAGQLPAGLTIEAEPFSITVKSDATALRIDLILTRVAGGLFAPSSNALPARNAAKPGVVLRVYSDFQCPYCQQFESETLPAVLRALPDDVRIEFHQLPLESIHPLARPAAEASECAAQQGKFWVYKDALFRDQSWFRGDSAAVFTALAGGLKLNMATFKTCLSARGGKSAVDAGLAEARRLNLNGTPSVFVGPYQAPDPYDAAALLELIKFTRAVETAKP